MFSTEFYTFLAVAEYGSFHKAAERLHFSPPAVMKHINRLEGELGFLLFQRSHKGIHLTKEGERFYRDTMGLKKQYEADVARIRKLAERKKRVIRVGHSILRPAGPLIELWHHENPFSSQFEFQIVPFSDDSDNMEKIYENFGKEFDILIGICDVESCKRRRYKAFQYTEISKKPFCVGVPYGHPLAAKESLEISDLLGEKLVMLTPGSSVFVDTLAAFLGEHYPGIELDLSHQHYDIGMFNKCITEGSLILTNDSWREVHPSIRTVSVNWENYTTQCIMYPVDAGEDILKFIQIVQSYL